MNDGGGGGCLCACRKERPKNTIENIQFYLFFLRKLQSNENIFWKKFSLALMMVGGWGGGRLKGDAP